MESSLVDLVGPPHSVILAQQKASAGPVAAAVGGGAVEAGEAVDEAREITTFSSYMPTCLPSAILEIVNGGHIPALGATTTTTAAKGYDEGDVIVLSDDDSDEDDDSDNNDDDHNNGNNGKYGNGNDGNNAITTTITTTLSVPSHSFPAVESSLMRSISSPEVPVKTFELFQKILTNGATKLPLSPLQLEGALLCINRHRRVFSSSQTQLDLQPQHVQQHVMANPATATGLFLSTPKESKRAGFFLGDGAGIGKGRQISAVIFDSIIRGRPRHLWVSVSRELQQDAIRDLRDIGCNVPVFNGAELLDRVNYEKRSGASAKRKALGNGKDEDGGSRGGVLFITYQLLISGTRLHQTVNWLKGGAKNDSKDFDGVVIFDEAHKAKNMEDDTQTAQKVLEIQQMLPFGRFVYASATGVSDIKHMVYADRLMLWGEFTSFGDFAEFKKCLDERGIGGLELLSLEMKMGGGFVARTLSWEGSEFSTVTVDLDEEQEKVYNLSCEFWKLVRGKVAEAVEFIKRKGGKTNSTLMRVCWAAQQRFFKEMAVSAKMPWLISDIKKEISAGHHCVIGLQTTGEAGTLNMLDVELKMINYEKYGSANKTDPNLRYESLKFKQMISTCGGILRSFLYNNFPVKSEQIELPPEPAPLEPHVIHSDNQREQYIERVVEYEKMKALVMQPIVEHEELIKMRDELIDQIEDLNLPGNCIDTVIDELGGVAAVAELTGRTGRMVRDARDGMFKYVKRAGGSEPRYGLSSQADIIAVDQVNIVEKQKFMSGEKCVAIISDAASTGISLHASSSCRSRSRRRIHYTIELPWAADKAIQQLGRTHRSGQDSAPCYKLVVSNLGGENRFAAAVAKRMASMGALTKGDRRAATGSSMGEFDIDSKHGREGLKKLYDCALLNNNGILPTAETSDILRTFFDEYGSVYEGEYDAAMDKTEMHILGINIIAATLIDVGLEKGEKARDSADVKAFLTKIQGAPVGTQNLLFAVFESCVKETVQLAKNGGFFEGAVEDISATSIKLKSRVLLAIDHSTGAKTELASFEIDRGVGLEDICEYIEENHLQTEKEKKAENEVTSVTEDAADGIDSDSSADSFIVDDDDSDDDDLLGEVEEEEDGGAELAEDELASFLLQDNGEDNDKENAASAGPQLRQAKQKSRRRQKRASTGFYLSKNKMFGRMRVLFARRKVEKINSSEGDDVLEIDPQGLMLLTRPNTGHTTQEKTRYDLQSQYNCVATIEELRELKSKDNKTLAEVFSSEYPRCSVLWSSTYEESNMFEPNRGLAPRKQEFGLVVGACMHVLPALVRAVDKRGKKDKSLRVNRISETGDGKAKFVGIRFPIDVEARELLDNALGVLMKARSGRGRLFRDEEFARVDEKSVLWATKERKNIVSFFGGGGEGKKAPKSFFSSSSSSSSSSPSPSSLTSSASSKAGPLNKKPKIFNSSNSSSKTSSKTKVPLQPLRAKQNFFSAHRFQDVSGKKSEEQMIQDAIRESLKGE